MLTGEQIKQAYDRIHREAGIYADDLGFYRWIIRILRPEKNKRLLDVACGQGHLVQEAARAGLEVCGLDISPEAIEWARRVSPASSFMVGEAENLPWPNGHFDYVTCLGSLENMVNPWKALSEMVRVTREGGWVCVQVPNLYWMGDMIEVLFRKEQSPPFQEVNRWSTRLGWRAFLMEAGLRVEREFRHNRPAVLFREGRLRSLRKFLARSLLNLTAPFDWSWSFVFLCRKTGSSPPEHPRLYCLFEERQVPFQRGRRGPDA